MFEFNGWAVLQYHTHGTNELMQNKAVKGFISYIKNVDTENVSVIKKRNGLDSLLISGLHNHRAGYVIEIFHLIAKELPGSYGLLYIHDDEDVMTPNKFTVWKLSRGILTKEDDPFLSPYIPTVEDDYDPTSGD